MQCAISFLEKWFKVADPHPILPPPRSLEISCCLLNIPRSGGDKVEGMWMKGGRSRAVYRVVYEQRVEWK